MTRTQKRKHLRIHGVDYWDKRKTGEKRCPTNVHNPTEYTLHIVHINASTMISIAKIRGGSREAIAVWLRDIGCFEGLPLSFKNTRIPNYYIYIPVHAATQNTQINQTKIRVIQLTSTIKKN